MAVGAAINRAARAFAIAREERGEIEHVDPAAAQLAVKFLQEGAASAGFTSVPGAPLSPDKSPPSAAPARAATRSRARAVDDENRRSPGIGSADSGLRERVVCAAASPQKGPCARKRSSLVRNSQPSAPARTAAFFFSSPATFVGDFATKSLRRLARRGGAPKGASAMTKVGKGERRFAWKRERETGTRALANQFRAASRRTAIRRRLFAFFPAGQSAGCWRVVFSSHIFIFYFLPLALARLLRAGGRAAALAEFLAHPDRLRFLRLGRAALHAPHVRDHVDRLAHESGHRA